MGFNAQRAILPSVRSQVVPVSTLVIAVNGPSQAFLPADDGPLICRLVDDVAEITINVIGGVVYPLAITSIPGTNLRSGHLLYATESS